MSSHYRTVAAGLGVGAVCLVMASLRWQHLLMFFALAGVGWAVWSWFRTAGQKNPPANETLDLPVFTPPFPTRRPSTGTSGTSARENNVYQFPTRQWNLTDVGS